MLLPNAGVYPWLLGPKSLSSFSSPRGHSLKTVLAQSTKKGRNFRDLVKPTSSPERVEPESGFPATLQSKPRTTPTFEGEKVQRNSKRLQAWLWAETNIDPRDQKQRSSLEFGQPKRMQHLLLPSQRGAKESSMARSILVSPISGTPLPSDLHARQACRTLRTCLRLLCNRHPRAL